MTEPTRTYLPAAGRDIFLPFYDVLTRLIGADRWRRALIEQAELRPGDRVLDLGCGTGGVLALVAAQHPGVELVGLDPDPKALSRARRKLDRGGHRARLDRGFADALPYPDAAFDRVLSALVIHHLERDERVAAFREVGRVLRPGGRFELMDFAGPHDPSSRLLPRLLRSHARIADNDSQRILELMHEAGLDRARVVARDEPLFGSLVRYRALVPEHAA